jgi:NACHT domain
MEVAAEDKDQTAGMRFSFSLQTLDTLIDEEDDESISIPISLTNKLTDNSYPIRITVKCTPNTWRTPELTSSTELPLNGSMDFSGDNKPLQFHIGTHYLEVTSSALSGTAANHDGDVVSLSLASIPYGQYDIEYRMIGNGREQNQHLHYLTHVSMLFAAHQIHSMVLEKPSLFQNISKTLYTKEGGFVSVLASLLLALVASLRRKIEQIGSHILETLGTLGLSVAAKRKFLRIYLNNVLSGHKYLRLVGFNVAGLPRPLLEEVYISLRVSAHGLQFAESRDDDADTKNISFAEAVRRFERLVILGPPGAGKTTTLSYIALQFATGRGLQSFKIRKSLFPIYIPLRRLSGSAATILSDLLDLKTQILPEEVIREYPTGYIEKKLERGECIILFDGLDEVTDEDAHRAIADRINNFVERYHANRFIVTCRIAGWRNLLPAFTVLEADDLSREEIHRFIRGWHAAIIILQERNRLEQEFSDPEERDKRWQESLIRIRVAIDDYSRRLLNSIDSSARILSIATNPMLLSLICLVHLNRNILPRGRALLYGQCVEFLMDAWERSKGFLVTPSHITASQKEMVLRQIAFELHVSGKGELSRTELEVLVEGVAAKLAIGGPASELLEDIERRSGILVERSIDVLGFSHLTLQEYLVAKHIQMNPVLTPTLFSLIDNQEWREVVLLYAGLIEDASDLVKRLLIDRNPSRLAVAGHCIGEAQRVEQESINKVVGLLLALLARSPRSPQTTPPVMP